MLAIHGIFDGKSVKITEKINTKKKYKVIITFLEEIDSNEEELRSFTAQTSGLDFWNNPKEDIYQDYLLKKQ